MMLATAGPWSASSERGTSMTEPTASEGKALFAGDSDQDGRPDVWVRDTDGDGVADTYEFDTDGDGKPDLTIIDRDQDGKPDEIRSTNA
jgi:hypothetical protein